MSKAEVDWGRYLADYHARNPGITERLLNRAKDRRGRTPYQRLVDSIPADASNVLDIACGSAPVARVIPDHLTYVGIDRSPNELNAARVHAAGARLVAGDALKLPFTRESFDCVVCSMALMLMRPVGAAIVEAHRVLAETGTFVAMYPDVGLPARHQLLAVSTLLASLRATPKYPQRLGKAAIRAHLQNVDLTLISYRTIRYSMPLTSATEASDIVNGLYLPGISHTRIERAGRLLARIATPTRSLPMHITHVVAIREPRA